MIGNQVGDRVVILTSADDAFGAGGRPDLGIGNKDSVLAIVDIMGRKETVPPLDGPQGEEKKPAGWAPTLIEKDGVITGLDFSTAHKPTGKLIATTLIKGDGAKVKAGQTLTVDWVHLKLNDQAQRTVLCKDPFKAYDERVQRLIDGM
jgi:peptidylprolyl isomerase